jgi:hypothetical protein
VKRDIQEGAWEWNPAVYLEGQIRAGRLQLYPGLRADYFSAQRVTFDPRLNARIEIAPRTFAKAGIGLYHQAAGAPYADALLGNPRLRPEQALHLSVGIATTPFAKIPTLHGELTLFYKDLRHLPEPSDARVQRDGAIVDELYTDNGIGRVYGLELLLRRDVAPWFYGWIAYTLLRSERQDVPGGPWRPFAYDQTHILTVVGTFRLPWNLNVGLRFRYVTGNPATPTSAAIFLSDYDVYLPIAGAPFSTRMPDFNQLDLRIDKRFVFPLWVLSIYVDVQNVYNRANVEGYATSYDYSRQVPVTGLPILPALGVKGEF